MQNLKIALVQMQALAEKNLSNLNKIINFTKEASLKKAQIICFPELSVCGYHKPINPNFIDSFFEDSLNKLQKLSSNYKITILTGLAEKNSPDRPPYISQFLFNPSGEIKAYRKTHLGKSEALHFSSGDKLPVFKTPKATIGIELCWETHFPEISTILALKGAEIIFAPHASPTQVGNRKEVWLKYLRTRAYDNNVFFAACNLLGENGHGKNFAGGALVLDPRGNIIAEDFKGKEGLLLAELDALILENIKDKTKTSMKDRYYLENRRPELYQKICENNDL